MSTTGPPSDHYRLTPPTGRRRRGLELAVMVLACLAALALATWVGAASHPPGRAAHWREDLALALVMTGSIAALAGLVWMLGVGTFTSGDISQARSAARVRRAAATEAIRHGQPMPLEEVDLASAIARTMVRRRASTPSSVGTSATCMGLILLAPRINALALSALGATALCLALNAPTFADTARARRWLRHASTSPAAGRR